MKKHAAATLLPSLSLPIHLSSCKKITGVPKLELCQFLWSKPALGMLPNSRSKILLSSLQHLELKAIVILSISYRLLPREKLSTIAWFWTPVSDLRHCSQERNIKKKFLQHRIYLGLIAFSSCMNIDRQEKIWGLQVELVRGKWTSSLSRTSKSTKLVDIYMICMFQLHLLAIKFLLQTRGRVQVTKIN